MRKLVIGLIVPLIVPFASLTSCNSSAKEEISISIESVDLTSFTQSDIDSIMQALLDENKVSNVKKYDVHGNLLEEITFRLQSNIIYSKDIISYVYDNEANIIEKHSAYFRYVYDSTGIVTDTTCWSQLLITYRYKNGSLVHEELFHPKEGENGEPVISYSYKYDTLGNIQEKEEFNRGDYKKILYQYDKNSNKTSELWVDSLGQIEHIEKFKYNEKNLIIEHVYNSSTTNYIYEFDSSENVIKKTTNNDSDVWVENYYYNSSNQLIRKDFYTGNKLYEVTLLTYTNDGSKKEEYKLTSCGCGYNHQEVSLYTYKNSNLFEIKTSSRKIIK